MNRFYRFIRGFFGGFFKLVYRVKIVGRENEVTDKPYIVCANHTSLMDVVMLVISFKGQINFMAKKEIFKVPFSVPLLRLWEAFPLTERVAMLPQSKRQ